MPPRFPTRYRDGFAPSAVGTAEYLRRAAGGDWQKMRTADGRATVSRDGMFMNVTTAPVKAPTRMYMIAMMAHGRAWVFGSEDGANWVPLGDAVGAQRYAHPFVSAAVKGVELVFTTGTPTDSSIGPAIPGGGGFSTNYTDRYGLRWWLDRAQFGIGTQFDETGNYGVVPAQVYNYRPSCQVYAFDDDYPEYADHYVQNPVSDPLIAVKVLPGGYWLDGGRPKWYAGNTYIRLNESGGGHQPEHAFRRFWLTETGFEIGYEEVPTVPVADAAPFGVSLCTLAPGRLLKLDTFTYPMKYRPNTDHLDIDELDPDAAGWLDAPRKPMAIMSLSADAGRTWAQVSAPIMDDELADLQTALNDYSYYVVSNHGADQDDVAFLSYDTGAPPVRMWTAPLSRALSVIVVEVPYPLSATHWRWRLKMGTVGTDGIAHGAVTLDEGDGAHFGFALIQQLLALEGEVLLVRRNSTDPYGTPAQIYSTTDGETLSLRGVMPANGNRCGPIMAMTASILVATVYDGKTASLFESRDRGASWAVRCVISNNVMPQADDAFPTYLTELAFIERQGTGQSAYPATPWLTDCRIPHA